jgi:tetratricopeptide (TPR) repeat protein
VRKAGDKVRVTTQLINVAEDAHIWSETYDRELTDVFAIQSDVAGQIARVLVTALSADEASLIGERPTRSLAAWQSFVAARSIYRSRLGADDIERAISLVDAAIEQDPEFARAHSLRAALLLGPALVGSLDRQTAANLQLAIATAEHALELAPSLGEPYFVLAKAAYWQGRLWDADGYFRDAIARAPNNADGRTWYGSFLASAGYLRRGWSEMQRSAELDPLSPVNSWQVAFAALTIGHMDAVRAYALKSRQNGWPDWQPRAIEAGVALQTGQFDQAEELYLAAMPEHSESIAIAFRAIRNGAIDTDTRAHLDRLMTYGPPGLSSWNTEVMAGDIDAAFASARAAVSAPLPDGGDRMTRTSNIQIGETLRADWWFPASRPFREDPRFVGLMETVGLMAFWRQNGWPDLCQPVGDTLACR